MFIGKRWRQALKTQKQAFKQMPQEKAKVSRDVRWVLLVAFLANLLHTHGATAQSAPVDPDNNNGVPLSTVNGTVYAWCDYGLQNVAGAGGLVEISETAKYGPGAGARIHTAQRYTYGNFSALIKCPAGDTSGLVPNFYVSSGETADVDPMQDEIDFEWLGRNKTVVQVTYFVNGNSTSNGTDNGAKIDLGFDCSEAFHEYRIEWTPAYIMWYIDGQVVKTAYNRTGQPFPTKPSFLYSGLWDASDIANGEWAGGPNSYQDAPFVYQLSNVTIKPYTNNTAAGALAPAPAQLPVVALPAQPPTVATAGGLQTDPPSDLPQLSQAPTGVSATNVGPTASPIAKRVETVASKFLVPIITACVALVLLVGGVTTCILVRRRKVHAVAPGVEGLAKASLAPHSAADEEVGARERPPLRPSLLQQMSMRMSMRHQDLKAGSFVRIQL